MGPLNLYKSLSKYGSREEENFLTESFVFLIKTLVERNPTGSVIFLNDLCGLCEKIDITDLDLFSISTQVVLEKGRPDIEIRFGSAALIFIEVKHDAVLGDRQLEYYKEKLEESAIPKKRLVLLTRSLASARETTLKTDEFHHICWYDVHNWLANLKDNSDDQVGNFLVEQFLIFLEDKQMSLEQIKWEYINGVPALVAFGNLLEVALIEAIPDVKLKKNAGWTWRGFGFENIWCGIRFDNPLILVYENNSGSNPSYKKDLDLNKAHFFSLTQSEQLECLVSFVKNARADFLS
jgi:hypothetical protein